MDRRACDNIAPIPQFSGVCWMTSILACLLYSDKLRKIVEEASKTWVNASYSKSIIKTLVDKQLKLSDDSEYPAYYFLGLKNIGYEPRSITSEYSEFHNEFSTEKLLRELHAENPRVFFHNPDATTGCNAYKYIGIIFKHLEIKNFIVFNAIQNYGCDKTMNLYKDAESAHYSESSSPSVIIIKTGSIYRFSKELKGKFREVFKECNIIHQCTLKKTLKYNNANYTLECMVLNNYNQISCGRGHAIACITCEKEKYLYNGWLIRNKKPCPLIKYDWLDTDKTAFTIRTPSKLADCKVTEIHNTRLKEVEDKYLVFKNGYTEQDGRVMIYIKNQSRSRSGTTSSPSSSTSSTKSTAASNKGKKQKRSK
jgi:hypothetical protein